MRGRLLAVACAAMVWTSVWGVAAHANTYSWTYDGRLWRIEAALSESMLGSFRAIPRGSDYSAYVEHPDNAAAVKDVVEQLRRAADVAGYAIERTAGLVITFVQSLPYVADGGSGSPGEYPNYPLETLAAGGDCEDKAILAAALMKALGMSVGLLHFISTLPAHMAVGIALPASVSGTYFPHEGKRYYYGETTEPGWGIGEVPPSYRGALAYIEPL